MLDCMAHYGHISNGVAIIAPCPQFHAVNIDNLLYFMLGPCLHNNDDHLVEANSNDIQDGLC